MSDLTALEMEVKSLSGVSVDGLYVSKSTATLAVMASAYPGGKDPVLVKC